jgi:hypothetical protein
MTVAGHKKLENLANAATILAVIAAFVILLSRGAIFDTHRAPALPVGKTLSFAPDRGRNANIVLVLSSDCRFCTESAPFYRRLMSNRSSKAQVTAVLPQELRDSQVYLRSLGITPDRVVRARPGSLGLSGTPTILITDNRGKVTAGWEGRLSQKAEAEVLKRAALECASCD